MDHPYIRSMKLKNDEGVPINTQQVLHVLTTTLSTSSITPLNILSVIAQFVGNCQLTKCSICGETDICTEQPCQSEQCQTKEFAKYCSKKCRYDMHQKYVQCVCYNFDADQNMEIKECPCCHRYCCQCCYEDDMIHGELCTHCKYDDHHCDDLNVCQKAEDDAADSVKNVIEKQKDLQLILPINGIKNYIVKRLSIHKLNTLKQKIDIHIFAVQITAILEYLTSEILDLSSNKAIEDKINIIVPFHIQLAIDEDKELKLMFQDSFCKQIYDIDIIWSKCPMYNNHINFNQYDINWYKKFGFNAQCGQRQKEIWSPTHTFIEEYLYKYFVNTLNVTFSTRTVLNIDDNFKWTEYDKSSICCKINDIGIFEMIFGFLEYEELIKHIIYSCKYFYFILNQRHHILNKQYSIYTYSQWLYPYIIYIYQSISGFCDISKSCLYLMNGLIIETMEKIINCINNSITSDFDLKTVIFKNVFIGELAEYSWRESTKSVTKYKTIYSTRNK